MLPDGRSDRHPAGHAAADRPRRGGHHRPELRHLVIALFDAWWDKTPPRRTRQEKLAADNALKRAALNDWPCPAGLDEDQLDQAGYQPQCGWRHASGTGVADDHPLAERKAAS